MPALLKIGIDIGGVLATHKTDVGDGEHTNTGIDMPGAVEAVRTLAAAGHTLVIVSYCGKRRAYESRDALRAAGISDCFAAMYFVKKPTHKKHVCASLGLDALVDDRGDILRAVVCGTHRIKFADAPIDAGVFHATDWAAVLSLLPTLPPLAAVVASGESLASYIHELTE